MAYNHGTGSHKVSWRPGQVAFLLPVFAPVDELALGDYVDRGARNHPVIVLDVAPNVNPTHALVTTVSSYRWSQAAKTPGMQCQMRKFPWDQRGHRGAQLEDWRSFAGSAAANKKPLLHLRGAQQFPLPQSSWVHVRSAWVVPFSTLNRFVKDPIPRGVILEVRPDSLKDLRAHMGRSCPSWADCQVRLKAIRAGTAAPAPPVAPVAAPVAAPAPPAPPVALASPPRSPPSPPVAAAPSALDDAAWPTLSAANTPSPPRAPRAQTRRSPDRAKAAAMKRDWRPLPLN